MSTISPRLYWRVGIPTRTDDVKMDFCSRLSWSTFHLVTSCGPGLSGSHVIFCFRCFLWVLCSRDALVLCRGTSGGLLCLAGHFLWDIRRRSRPIPDCHLSDVLRLPPPPSLHLLILTSQLLLFHVLPSTSRCEWFFLVELGVVCGGAVCRRMELCVPGCMPCCFLSYVPLSLSRLRFGVICCANV